MIQKLVTPFQVGKKKPQENHDAVEARLRECIVNANMSEQKKDFLIRGVRAVLDLSEIDSVSLRNAVRAPTDYDALVIAARNGQPFPLREYKALDRAFVRGIEIRRELLTAEGGCYKAEDVCEILHISRQAVNLRLKAKSLLAVRMGGYAFLYPKWQFTVNGLIQGFVEVLKELEPLDAWMKMAFFLGKGFAVGGETPLQALRKGNLEAVLEAAKMYGDQGPA